MTGDYALDRIDRTEPDPLQAAEADVEQSFHIWCAAAQVSEQTWRDYRDARRALAALRAKLAAEADDELPFTQKEI